MAAKLKDLKKFIKKLNKADLLEEEIEISKDVEEMQEAFFDGMEEIDSDGNLDDVPDDVFDYYEKLTGEGEGEEEEEEEGGDDLREELEEMTKKELRSYIKKNKIDVTGKGKKPAIIDSIIEAMSGEEEDDDEEEETPKKTKKGKKGRKGKKGKKGKKAKKEEEDEPTDDDPVATVRSLLEQALELLDEIE